MLSIVLGAALLWTDPPNDDCVDKEKYMPVVDAPRWCQSPLLIKSSEKAVSGVLKISPKTQGAPVYKRSVFKGKQEKGVDYAHLFDPMFAKNRSEVLLYDLSANRVHMSIKANRKGIWKQLEKYTFDRALILGDVIDVSGMSIKGSDKYFYKILTTPATGATIAFMFKDGVDINIKQSITTIGCIEKTTGQLFEDEVWRYVKHAKAHSLDIWTHGGGDSVKECKNV